MYSDVKTLGWNIAVYKCVKCHLNQMYVYVCLFSIKTDFSIQFHFTCLDKITVSCGNALIALGKNEEIAVGHKYCSQNIVYFQLVQYFHIKDLF